MKQKKGATRLPSLLVAVRLLQLRRRSSGRTALRIRRRSRCARIRVRAVGARCCCGSGIVLHRAWSRGARARLIRARARCVGCSPGSVGGSARYVSCCARCAGVCSGGGSARARHIVLLAHAGCARSRALPHAIGSGAGTGSCHARLSRRSSCARPSTCSCARSACRLGECPAAAQQQRTRQ